jgi:hypothetical protein
MIEQFDKAPIKEQEPEAAIAVEYIKGADGTVEFAPDSSLAVATFIQLIEEPTKEQFTAVMNARHAELAQAA